MGSPALFFVEKSGIASVRSGVDPHRPVLAFYATPAKKTETGGILMYDRKSDYALNKQNRNAIVCGSVTGVHIRLTRSDFSSEEEFQKWKAWSDWDYHTTEKAGRAYHDNRLPLADWAVPSAPSAEELLLEADGADAARAALIQQIRNWPDREAVPPPASVLLGRTFGAGDCQSGRCWAATHFSLYPDRKESPG